MNDLAQRLAELMRGLGGSAGAVAVSLRKAGVRGTPQRCCACPLANFLTRESGSPIATTQHSAGPDSAKPGEWVPLPRACVEFVEAFDRGEFPDLSIAFHAPEVTP